MKTGKCNGRNQERNEDSEQERFHGILRPMAALILLRENVLSPSENPSSWGEPSLRIPCFCYSGLLQVRGL